jgi:PAS domain-containing protein
MSTLQSLTLKRNTALGKLTTLQRRAERITGPEASVVRSTVAELESALEELQVATEQLQAYVDELAAERYEADRARRRLAEFVDVLPIACLWTNVEGAIEGANPEAADLLNVSLQRLNGRPLMLFLADRQGFEQAISALNQGVSRAVTVEMMLRPRERRPRAVRITGRRLASHAQLCWFLTSMEGPVPGTSSSPSTDAHDIEL